MSSSSSEGPNDCDTVSHDATRTVSDSPAQECRPSENTREMQETAQQATQELTHRPPRVQVECHEATDADSTDAGSERQPSKRFHLEPADILAWRAHVRKYGRSKQRCRSIAPSAPTSVEDLTRDLENQLNLFNEESFSDGDISFAGVGTDFGPGWSRLVEREPDLEDIIRCSSASLLPGFGSKFETDSAIECFVGDCSIEKSYISDLLRHAAQAHSFFYCNDCCNGFSTQEAKNAYLPQCRNFCMSPRCVPDSAAVSLTGDPQSQRHLRTQECPTLGRVNDKHKLEFLKCTYRAVYPEGTEPSTSVKRKSKAKSISRSGRTKGSLRSTTDAKVCKTCRNPEPSNGEHKDKEARLLNIIRHQISKSGLDPFLESSLLLDAPELLQEFNKPSAEVSVSQRTTSGAPLASVAQAAPGSQSFCVASAMHNAASDATAREVTAQADPSLGPPLFEDVSFAEKFSSEQFDEIVRSMTAEGNWPLGPQNTLQDASLYGWDLGNDVLH